VTKQITTGKWLAATRNLPESSNIRTYLSTDAQCCPAKTGLDCSGAIQCSRHSPLWTGLQWCNPIFQALSFIHFIPSVLIIIIIIIIMIMYSRYEYIVVQNIAGKYIFLGFR
jgi:hypothetical protein